MKSPVPQVGGQLNGEVEVVGHGEDEHISGGGVQIVIEIALVLQDEEQTGQTDGDTDAGELFIGVIFR